MTFKATALMSVKAQRKESKFICKQRVLLKLKSYSQNKQENKREKEFQSFPSLWRTSSFNSLSSIESCWDSAIESYRIFESLESLFLSLRQWNLALFERDSKLEGIVFYVSHFLFYKEKGIKQKRRE